jgi:hypothetical protein
MLDSGEERGELLGSMASRAAIRDWREAGGKEATRYYSKTAL